MRTLTWTRISYGWKYKWRAGPYEVAVQPCADSWRATYLGEGTDYGIQSLGVYDDYCDAMARCARHYADSQGVL